MMSEIDNEEFNLDYPQYKIPTKTTAITIVLYSFIVSLLCTSIISYPKYIELLKRSESVYTDLYVLYILNFIISIISTLWGPFYIVCIGALHNKHNNYNIIMKDFKSRWALWVLLILYYIGLNILSWLNLIYALLYYKYNNDYASIQFITFINSMIVFTVIMTSIIIILLIADLFYNYYYVYNCNFIVDYQIEMDNLHHNLIITDTLN